MQANELKFLLHLLGHPSYRAPLTKLEISKKDKICRDLAKLERVAYDYEIKRFKISNDSKGLLKQEAEVPYLTEKHFLILKACELETITPGKVKKLRADERQPLIKELKEKGLITVEEEKIKEVWLTERGAEYLREEFNPNGSEKITFKLLGNYLNFMRKSIKASATPEQPQSTAVVLQAKSASKEVLPIEAISQEKPTDEKILQTIRDLDQEIRTDNYLPIFHLRKKLQPPLSRDELDQALYRLQKQDKLELSSLVGASQYESEEIQAGIPQDSGGPLFFLIVNE